MDTSLETTRELALLESIESDPDVTQASLATQLDVAVGTVNWHIKRLIEKGYINTAERPRVFGTNRGRRLRKGRDPWRR